MALKPQDSFHKGNFQMNPFLKIGGETTFPGWVGVKEGEDPGFRKRNRAWVFLVLRYWKAAL